MTRFIDFVRKRDNIVGTLALICVVSGCILLLEAGTTILVIAYRGGPISAEQLNLLTIAGGLSAGLFAFAGGLLAVNTTHGRATDPLVPPPSKVTTTVETEVEGEA